MTSAAAPTNVQLYYADDSGVPQTLGLNVVKAYLAHVAGGPSVVVQGPYSFDFAMMTQTNNSTRKVRWIVKTEWKPNGGPYDASYSGSPITHGELLEVLADFGQPIPPSGLPYGIALTRVAAILMTPPPPVAAASAAAAAASSPMSLASPFVRPPDPATAPVQLLPSVAVSEQWFTKADDGSAIRFFPSLEWKLIKKYAEYTRYASDPTNKAKSKWPFTGPNGQSYVILFGPSRTVQKNINTGVSRKMLRVVGSDSAANAGFGSDKSEEEDSESESDSDEPSQPRRMVAASSAAAAAVVPPLISCLAVTKITVLQNLDGPVATHDTYLLDISQMSVAEVTCIQNAHGKQCGSGDDSADAVDHLLNVKWASYLVPPDALKTAVYHNVGTVIITSVNQSLTAIAKRKRDTEGEGDMDDTTQAESTQSNKAVKSNERSSPSRQ